MFKNLKQKIGDGLANSPARNILSAAANRQDGATTPRQRTSAETTPVVTPSGSLLDLRSPPGSEPVGGADGVASPQPSQSGPHIRSRTSSISSQASEAAILSPYTLPSVTVTPYSALFDTEGSVSEAETEEVASGTSATALSKDELYRMYNKVLRRGQLYKGKLSQVLAAYKEMEKDRDKFKTTLTQTQDKSLRRISELKEQIELDKGAKKDLENNYTLMLDEKDELITVLRMQIRLLKEGKSVPDELLMRSGENNEEMSEQRSDNRDVNSNVSPEEVQALKEKIKRLEALLQKCKETITANKERTQQLTANHEALSKQLQAKCDELEKVRAEQSSSKAEQSTAAETYRAQLKEAKKLIKDLETDKAMSIASAKQELHAMLESKDSELLAVQERCQAAETRATEAEELAEKLRVAGEQQLEKSREVIKRLKDQKKALETDGQRRLETSEQTLEQEKESELQELRRGKVEALNVLQRQLEEKVEEMKREREEALLARDKEWEEKIAVMEQKKSEELQLVLKDRLEESELAVEEQQLQKIATVKQLDSQIENMQQRINELTKENEALKSAAVETLSTSQGGDKEGENDGAKERKRIAELERELAEMRKSVQNSANAVLGSGSSELPENESQVQQQQQSDELSTKVDELTAQLTAAESHSKELESRLEELGGERERLDSELQTMTYSHRRVVEEKMEAESRLSSCLDTIDQFEARINDLIDRENSLNTELEQTKVDNERRLEAQTAEMMSMKALVEQLKSSEEQLIHQMSLTTQRCDEQLDRASKQSEQAIGGFMSELQGSQSELMNLLGALEATKTRSNQMCERLQRQVDERTEQLEQACCMIEELGGERPVFNFNSGIDTQDGTTTEPQTESLIDFSSFEPTASVSQANGLALEPETQTNGNATLLQNSSTNHSPSLKDVQQRLDVAERERMLLVDKLRAYESSMIEGNPTSQGLLSQIENLERLLGEKDEQIRSFEAKVEGFGEELQREMEEVRERNRQVEQLMTDKDAVIREKEEMLTEKERELEEQQQILQQLKSEAKSRILALRVKLQEKQAASLPTDAADLLKKQGEEFEQERSDFIGQIENQKEEFERSRLVLELKHATEIKALAERLTQEEQNFNKFKESVKQQFEERQIHVRYMIEKLQSNHDQSLRDRDEAYELSKKNLEREKNREKNKEVGELMKTIEQLKAEISQYKGNHIMEETLTATAVSSTAAVEETAIASDTAAIEPAMAAGDIFGAEISKENIPITQENLIEFGATIENQSLNIDGTENAVLGTENQENCDTLGEIREEPSTENLIRRKTKPLPARSVSQEEAVLGMGVSITAELSGRQQQHDTVPALADCGDMGPSQSVEIRLQDIPEVTLVETVTDSSTLSAQPGVELDVVGLRAERDQLRANLDSTLLALETLQRDFELSRQNISELENSKAELENAQAQLKATQTQHIVLLESLEKVKEALAKVDEESSEIKSERDRLKGKLVLSTSELETLKSEHRNTIEELSRTEMEYSQLKEQTNEGQQSESSDLARTREELTASLKELEELKQAKNTDSDRTGEEFKKYNQELETVRGEKEAQMENINYLTAELESQKVRLRETVSQHQSEKESLLRHLEADKGGLMEQMQGLEAQLENERKVIAELRSESELLREQHLSEKESLLKNLKFDKGALMEQLQGLETQLLEERKIILGLRNENETQQADAEKNASKLQAELTELREEIFRLEGQASSLMEDKKTQKEAFDGQLTSLNEQIDHLKSAVDQNVAERNKFEEENKILNEQINSFRSELDERAADRVKLEESNKILNERIEDIDKEKLALIEEMQTRQNEMGQLNEKYTNLQETVRQLQEQLELTNKEKENLSTDNQELENRFQTNNIMQEENIRQLSTQVNEVNEEKLRLNRNIEELQTKFDQLQEDNLMLKQGTTEVQQHMDKIAQEKMGFSKEIEGLQNEISELNEKNTSLLETSRLLQEQLEQTNKEKENLSAANQELEKRFEAAEEGKKSLEEKLGNENRELHERLNDIEQRRIILEEESLQRKTYEENTITSYVEQIKALQTSLIEGEQKNSTLSLRVEELDRDLQNSSSELEILRKQATEVSAKHNEEAEKRVEAEKQVEQFSDEIARLKSKLLKAKQLSEELKSVRSERDRLKMELEEESIRLKDATARNEALSAGSSQAVQELEARLKNMEEETRAMRENHSSELEQQNTDLQKITDEYAEFRQAHDKNIAEVIARVEALQTQNMELEKDKEKVCEEFLSRIKELGESLSGKESEITATKAEIIELNERLQAEIGKANKDVEDYRRIVSEKNEIYLERQELSAQIVSKDAELSSLISQLDCLKESLEKSSQLQASLTSENRDKDQKLAEALDERDRRLGEIEEALEERNRRLRETEETLEQTHREHQFALDALRLEFETKLQEAKSSSAAVNNIEETDIKKHNTTQLGWAPDEKSKGWDIDDSFTPESPSKISQEQIVLRLQKEVEKLRQENARLAEESQSLHSSTKTSSGTSKISSGSPSSSEPLGGGTARARGPSNKGSGDEDQGWEHDDDLCLEETASYPSQAPEQLKRVEPLQGSATDGPSSETLQRLKEEYEAKIKKIEEQHNAKVVQLVKEFNGQMNSREKELSESFGYDTNAHEERLAQIIQDHKHQLRELHEMLDERDARSEELVQNYEAKLKKLELQCKARVEQLDSIIEDLQQQLLDKEHDLDQCRRSIAEKDIEIFAQQQDRRDDASLATASHKRGNDSLTTLGDEDALQSLELQNMNLQAEVNRHLADLAKAKIREREFKQELEMLRVAAGYSSGASNSYNNSTSNRTSLNVSGPLLTEPTELEYLRNILFKYMTGLETKTLAKVICTVVKFSDEQTKQVLEKEDSRSSIFKPIL